MKDYLVPLNYPRAHDVLRRLSVYTEYSAAGAQTALGTLRQSYPLIFSRMTCRRFARDAVMLEYPGAGVSGPLLFTSHVDAPVFPSILDCPDEMPLTVPLCRAHLVALLEALEELLSSGYVPSGDVILCLSMDGLSGGEGAKSMARHLETMGLVPCLVLDYGGYASMEAFRTFVPEGTPFALIGIQEKGEWQGRVNVVAGEPGSLRKPGEQLLKTGYGMLMHPNRARLCAASESMLKALGRKAPLPQRWAVSHPRLFFPLLRFLWRKRSVLRQFFLSERAFSAFSSDGDCLTAPTEASFRFRYTFVPGARREQLRQALRQTAKLHQGEIAFWVDEPASSLSPHQGPAWDALCTAVEIQFERALILPCLCPFPTDGRFYGSLHAPVYRFSPYLLTGREALKGQCTVSTVTLQNAVQFFRSVFTV